MQMLVKLFVRSASRAQELRRRHRNRPRVLLSSRSRGAEKNHRKSQLRAAAWKAHASSGEKEGEHERAALFYEPDRVRAVYGDCEEEM